MKNENKIQITKLTKQFIENAKTPRNYVNKKDFPDYFEKLDKLLYSAYAFEIATANPLTTSENLKQLENACYTNLKAVLQLFGKINNEYIKVNALTITENGGQITLFAYVLRASFKYKTEPAKDELSTLINEKKVLNELANARLKVDDIKGFKAYKLQIAEKNKKIKELQALKGYEKQFKTRNELNAFAKEFENLLRFIICGQKAKSVEQIEKEKKQLKAQRKARHEKQKAEKQKQAGAKQNKAGKDKPAKTENK